MLIIFFSVIVHEIAHGFIALKKGDPTARDAGRLTFNPIPHIDPIGTIILPIFLLVTHLPGIAWAKPVPINPYNFNNPKKDMLWVSSAGILSNFGLAIILSVLVRFFHISNPFLTYGIIINLLLAFFNLIPIPPLDGSKILAEILPYEAREKYLRIESFGFIIIILLIGFISSALMPIITFCFRLLTGIP
ncbi:MAG: site-2 protease family protein [bacterium]|nr:site-2 protease family protein [bacterium]